MIWILGTMFSFEFHIIHIRSMFDANFELLDPYFLLKFDLSLDYGKNCIIIIVGTIILLKRML